MTPKRYLAKADRALESACLLLADGDIEGACNRAYYAMFDAAQGALILSGATADPAAIRTHSGLIGAFGKHLVKTGRIPADLGRTLNQVERMRLLADYTGEEIEPERARWVVEQAATFLCAIKDAFAPD
ncbi:MAG: DNA-binding protein [Halochromatium sp.]|nr:DNA-binding protein [Halochromatium sp.]